MTGIESVAVVVGLAASAEDLWRRQVSNWIPLVAVTAGFVFHPMERGWSGLGSAAGGALGGFLIFLVFYLLGGMGGGDVKLMAGFGSLLGGGRLIEAAWLAAVFGMIAALLTLGWRRLRQGGFEGWRKVAIPYAPAITAGAWLVLLAHRRGA